jgi:hypothetical protein
MGEQSEANHYAKKTRLPTKYKKKMAAHLQKLGGYAKKQSISAVKAVDAETLF